MPHGGRRANATVEFFPHFLAARDRHSLPPSSDCLARQQLAAKIEAGWPLLISCNVWFCVLLIVPTLMMAVAATGGDAASLAGWAVLASAAIATMLLALAMRRLATTTLLGPAAWALIACWGVAGVELALVFGEDVRPSLAAALRYAAALLVFCPPLAALGAKRPQHAAWQLVVVSLWAVLSLPALEVLLIRPQQSLDAEGLRAWFLPVLILLGLANWLGTRYWPSALLAAAAQAAVLLPYFPLFRYALGPWGVVAALLSACLAILLGLLGLPRRRVAATGLNRVWLDFRDAFGVLWSLRLAEQFNATARSFDWKLRIDWDGFRATDDSVDVAHLPAEVDAVVRQNLKNLLRRFVSPAWLQSRLVPPTSPPTPGEQDHENPA